MAETNKLFSSSSTNDDKDEDDDEGDDDEDEEEDNDFDVDDISDMVVDHGLSPILVGYETVITACSYGWFQRILLMVCGWAFVSDSIEIQVVSFVLPAACDLEMTSSEKGWLNGIIFVGMMVGGYTFGGTADIKGRRFVLLCSLTINGLFGFLSAFAPTFNWFILFRLFSGVGVGAALPVLFSYFAEFLSRDLRGPIVEGLASFLLLGNIMAAGGAWFIIPLERFILFGHVVKSWRLFVALFSLPALSAALLFLFMPESPKFLIHNGQMEDARKVLIKMFKRNHRKAIVPRIITDMQFYEQIDENKSHGTTGSISKVFKATRSLFESDRLRATIPLLTIWFTMSFAYYGLWMWLPEIYKRIETSQGSFCSSNNFRNVNNNQNQRNISSNATTIYNTSVSNQTFLYSCTEPLKNSKIYLKTFVVAISNLPGAIITIATIDKAGRRNLLATSMLLSGIVVLFFLLVTTEIEMIVMSCIFSGLSVIAWNVLNAIALENYPTHLRSTAFGLQTSVGRIASIIGNVVFGLLIDVQCTVPLVFVTICFIVGGISVLIVPNTDRVMLS